jgi:hypothetical protein
LAVIRGHLIAVEAATTVTKFICFDRLLKITNRTDERGTVIKNLNSIKNDYKNTSLSLSINPSLF